MSYWSVPLGLGVGRYIALVRADPFMPEQPSDKVYTVALLDVSESLVEAEAVRDKLKLRFVGRPICEWDLRNALEAIREEDPIVDTQNDVQDPVEPVSTPCGVSPTLTLPKFYLVEGIPYHADEFEVVGLFSKKEDALAFREWAEKEGNYKGCASPQLLTMQVIKDLIVRDRLKEIAEALGPLIQKTSGS